jgi:uncharacterized protein YkwD
MAAATVVAALTACNPLVPTPSLRHLHTKPSTHPVTKSLNTPKPTSRPRAANPTTSASPTPTPTPTTSHTATPTPTPTATPTTGSASDVYEARILVLVNAERAQRSLRPLVANTCADGYAERWAPVLVHNGALSHQSLQPILTACHASSAGENVAYGNVTADQMMTMWMNSEGHRENILNPSYTAIGIAAVADPDGRWYGVQDFIGS